VRAPLTLLAVPNVSEGRDQAALDAIGAAFTAAGTATLLDRHADPDHHRAVFTLAGAPGSLAQALAGGAREALARIDLQMSRGAHPHVGAVDVVPLVHLDPASRGAACAEALVTGALLGDELGLPVLLYGGLAGGRTRAELRRGGIAELTQRLGEGELRTDFGPQTVDPARGVTLVAARPPLVAFNVELGPPASADDARRIASLIREGGAEGLPGVRAIGLELTRRDRLGQVSVNVEDPFRVSLAEVVAAVGRHATPLAGELVGLAPAAALEGFPFDTVPIHGFDPDRQVIERVLD
jgi:glutamate formiminotransferase/glutamate formiminotransferase/formiminotetrahydrofolate cyclodeaminase